MVSSRRFVQICTVVLGLGLFVVSTLLLQPVQTVQAAAGVNGQMNFQGRLLNASGAVVADGLYNIQFKIYQDGDGLTAGNTTGSPAGSLRWTESFLNVNSQGVTVKNGYMSVQLGSLCTFNGSTCQGVTNAGVDWNQDTLWLSMNIGSTNGSCANFASCTPDGEMLPMKRLSATPYSLNSNRLNGLTSSNFVQLAQGLQTDAVSGVPSVYINKTGTGNLLQLQSSGTDALTVAAGGDLTLGNSANRSISVATSAASTAGRQLSITAGTGGSGTGSTGGALTLQGGTGGGTNGAGGTVTIDGGAATGTGTIGAINIGTARASTIQIGSTTIASGTQAINVGTNSTSGSTTNVTIGSGSGATAGATTLQGKTSVKLTINGSDRLTINNSSATAYFGNGVTSNTPANFILSGTGSSATSVVGGGMTLQGGNATVGNANGGNVTLAGGSGFGTGVSGLVVLTTPTFKTATTQTCAVASCTITQANVDNNSAVIVGAQAGLTNMVASLPSPSNTSEAGRVVYVTAAAGSPDFTLQVNGGGTGNMIAMRQNTTATMIWNGSSWTAAGASSSTTLQSAYDNTLQSAGGAELVVSKTTATNGLTIRDSSSNSVNGTLLSVQTSSAASLLSINSNVKEYSTNSGAETAGSSSTAFPASTWLTTGSGSTVTRQDIAGNYIATGQGSVKVVTTATANVGAENLLTGALTANTTYNVSFATRLESGTFTDMAVHYSIDGTTISAPCTTGAASKTSIWTKVNCTFTTPASGITATNAILVRQVGANARTFYIDNMSVTIAADYNFATDGSVNDNTNFATNWSYSTGIGAGTVTRNTSDGYDASDSAQVAITAGAANAGVRNRLSSNPLPDTLYRMTVYAELNSGSAFTDFKIRYSRNGGTNYADCVDYNTQTLTATWSKITCYLTTDSTAATSPYVYFVEGSSAVRTFSVDAFSMTLATITTPNVQVGGGINGGPTTLLTLDKGASAPIASDNDALLGSMYYDTSLGKLQCYEADGWGACGSSPDNVVTISPEYTNAVMHGTGVGTMTSDICSSTLNINNGTSGQPTICSTNETYNFYKWTSPQASPQTYSIYVTYQLPSTFKSFASGQTVVMGRTNNGSQGGVATVNYQIYRSDATGLTACGSTVGVSTGTQSSWQSGTANGAADPSTCGFAPGNSIVIKINVTTDDNAIAYVSNLNFIFSNR